MCVGSLLIETNRAGLPAAAATHVPTLVIIGHFRHIRPDTGIAQQDRRQ